MSGLNSDFLFELRIPQRMSDIVDMGQTPTSRLMYSVAEKGSVEGPKIKGQVIPLSGGDWSRLRADMSITIEVRICLKTHDGANILMTYHGILAANSPEDFQYMIDATKNDDPQGALDRFYYRIFAFFETGDERYAWLNRTLAAGIGRLAEDQAIYDIYAIK